MLTMVRTKDTGIQHLQCREAHISKASRAPLWTSNSAQTMRSLLKSFSKRRSPLPRSSVTFPPACKCPWNCEDCLAKRGSSTNRYPRQRGIQAGQERHDREHWGWSTTRSYAVRKSSLTTAVCYNRSSARDTTQSLRNQALCSPSYRTN